VRAACATDQSGPLASKSPISSSSIADDALPATDLLLVAQLAASAGAQVCCIASIPHHDVQDIFVSSVTKYDPFST
jgi:hypothetical protein